MEWTFSLKMYHKAYYCVAVYKQDRQIGNAVPVLLARAIAKEFLRSIRAPLPQPNITDPDWQELDPFLVLYPWYNSNNTCSDRETLHYLLFKHQTTDEQATAT
jgi:hypothetical protein